MTENVTEKIIILGGGPAGFTAGLYAARAELNPLILTGMAEGGQASQTHQIENYPGFPAGVNGFELMMAFKDQAERFGARSVSDVAQEVVIRENGLFEVLGYSDKYLCRSLVVATGASPRLLNVPGEREFTGRGVSYCGTCDGWFFRDKEIVVVGGGDSALEEALFLTRFASSIQIVHRRDTLRASKILQTRAKENPKISFIWNSVVEEIRGDDGQGVNAVVLRNILTGDCTVRNVSGVFIFIGHKPNTDFLRGVVDMDERGYIEIDRFMQTSVPGIFAAGEVADPIYRQVITSAGMGASAAMQAVRYLAGG